MQLRLCMELFVKERAGRGSNSSTKAGKLPPHCRRSAHPVALRCGRLERSLLRLYRQLLDAKRELLPCRDLRMHGRCRCRCSAQREQMRRLPRCPLLSLHLHPVTSSLEPPRPALPSCATQQMRILNADQGAEAINSDFITFQNVVLDVTKPRWGRLPGAP